MWGVHHVLGLMLRRPRGRTELEHEGKRRPKTERLGCYLVRNWFKEQQLACSVGVPRYSLCPPTDEREVEVGIPVNLIDSVSGEGVWRGGSHLLPSHWMLCEVVLPKNHTLPLEDIIPPDTVHLPHALSISRTILPPCFPAHRVQDIIRGTARRKRERASPVPNRSWIAGCKHKRLESRCWKQMSVEGNSMRS